MVHPSLWETTKNMLVITLLLFGSTRALSDGRETLLIIIDDPQLTTLALHINAI